MKKITFLFRLTLLTLALFVSANIMAVSQTYTYTVTEKPAGIALDTPIDFGGTTWTISATWSNTGTFYFGNDATKGLQMGSGGNAVTKLNLKTTAIPGTIKSVKVNTSGGSKTVGIIQVKVATTTTSARTISATATDYTFNPNTKGEIDIEWTQEKAVDGKFKAFYIKSIEVVYDLGSTPTIIAPTDCNIFAEPKTTVKEIINVQGLNLTETITANITGTDAALFSVTGAPLTATGGNLEIAYAPIATGLNTATLTLRSGSATKTINLSGKSLVSSASTIAALRALTIVADTVNIDPTVEYTLNGEYIVNYNGDQNSVFIQDATGALMIFDYNFLKTIKTGDKISGIKGTLVDYRGNLELKPTAAINIISSSNATPPTVKTLAELSIADVSKLVEVKDITLTGTGNFAQKTSVAIVGSTVMVRPNYKDNALIGQPIPTTAQNIIGIILLNNAEIQIVPISMSGASSIKNNIATPAIYSAGGNIYFTATGGENVEIFNFLGQKLATATAIAGENCIAKPANQALIIKIGTQVAKIK